MKFTSIISLMIGIVGTILFTRLLITGCITPAIYLGLLTLLALIAIAIICLPRLKELDLKNLKLTLTELKEATTKFEKVKAEVCEMYGGIERIRKAPLTLDKAKMAELGLKTPGLPNISSVMRYTAGCFKRERERLACIFVSPKEPKKVAEAILDGSLDDKVFKWDGPEVLLDVAPRSVEERENANNKKD